MLIYCCETLHQWRNAKSLSLVKRKFGEKELQEESAGKSNPGYRLFYSSLEGRICSRTDVLFTLQQNVILNAQYYLAFVKLDWLPASTNCIQCTWEKIYNYPKLQSASQKTQIGLKTSKPTVNIPSICVKY